ncbi:MULTISPECIES: hypothetical protein [Janthinobacterium]|uniref:hypothetical protein n=1 Tax=Janthinobacterium TaxID=29580 RepID=UPI00117BD971|nr:MULTISPECIES: hypothetical protein [Janthinobacterium]
MGRKLPTTAARSGLFVGNYLNKKTCTHRGILPFSLGMKKIPRRKAVDHKKNSRFTLKDVLMKTNAQRLSEAPRSEKIIHYVFVFGIAIVIVASLVFMD